MPIQISWRVFADNSARTRSCVFISRRRCCHDRSTSGGGPRKREFGSWIVPIFRVLAPLKRLRGSRFDPFGMTAERRMERELIKEFEANVETILDGLNAGNVDAARHILSEYLEIRGYGPVKEMAAEQSRTRILSRLNEFRKTTELAA